MLAGVLGRLALRVVEVRGDGDDRLGDLLAEVVLGGLLQLLQDLRADLRRASPSCRGCRRRCRRSRARTTLYGHALRLFADLLEAATDEALGASRPCSRGW